MNIYWRFIYVSIVCVAILLLITFLKKRKESRREEEKVFWYKFMHFSCGFFVAMFLYGFMQYWFYIIIFTFLIGVIWELGEYFFGIYKLKRYGTKDYIPEKKDTISDLILDILGAILLILIINIIF